MPIDWVFLSLPSLRAARGTMAIAANVQALVAAFALSVGNLNYLRRHANDGYSGIVVNAASGAAFLYIKGHGSSFFRDGPRLALVLFLSFAAIWANTDFVAFMIDTDASTGCQAAVAIAASFDQLARVSLAQFLHWAINSGIKPSTATLVPQTLILSRFALGGVYVGVQKPQFNPVCVGSTSILPLSITVLAIDAVLVVTFLARFFSVGLLRDIREPRTSTARSKAILLTIAGLAVWTAVSIPLACVFTSCKANIKSR